MKAVRKAVLPVAGLGTRVLPAAKVTPKNLLNVFDRPILAHVVAEARAAGIEHFVFVTGRGQGAIEDYFDHGYELEAQLEAKGKADILADVRADLPKPGEMSFVRQMAPLGLGHAVWCARDIVGDEPFAVILPDMLMRARPSALAQAIAARDAVGGNIIVVEPAPAGETHKYGIVSLAETAAGFDDARADRCRYWSTAVGLVIRECPCPYVRTAGPVRSLSHSSWTLSSQISALFSPSRTLSPTPVGSSARTASPLRHSRPSRSAGHDQSGPQKTLLPLRSRDRNRPASRSR